MLHSSVQIEPVGVGLAEHTVFASCSHTKGMRRRPVVTRFDKSSLDLGQEAIASSGYGAAVVALVSCGHVVPRTLLAIAQELDRGQLLSCSERRIGEICLSSPSKAQGYWGRPELSRQIFRATIKDDPTRTEYLRTGDLGFVHQGELYVCGRLKDLIIIRGKNYYPQDIERTAEDSHQLLKPGCSAAFCVETEGGERLVLVAEVRGEPDKAARQAVLDALLHNVSSGHGLMLQAALLLKERSVPKTTSGKIKRRACKQGFEQWAGLALVGETTAIGLNVMDRYVSPTWRLNQGIKSNSTSSCDCCCVVS